MLGLFVSEGGISIIEADDSMLGVAPATTLHPSESRYVFHLIAVDALLVRRRAFAVAFYEEKVPNVWQLAARKEADLRSQTNGIQGSQHAE